VLCPLLYILYTADFAHVVVRHSLSLRQYADDSQIYMSMPVDRTKLQSIGSQYA